MTEPSTPRTYVVSRKQMAKIRAMSADAALKIAEDLTDIWSTGTYEVIDVIEEQP